MINSNSIFSKQKKIVFHPTYIHSRSTLLYKVFNFPFMYLYSCSSPFICFLLLKILTSGLYRTISCIKSCRVPRPVVGRSTKDIQKVRIF